MKEYLFDTEKSNLQMYGMLCNERSTEGLEHRDSRIKNSNKIGKRERKFGKRGDQEFTSERNKSTDEHFLKFVCSLL